MTTATPDLAPPTADATRADHRGSPIPTGAMIATRFMELRRRRGLMITLLAVTVGFPTVFLVVRLLLHAIAPKTYGPAGGYDIYTALSAGVLYTFGFIVAATLGSTAGSVDLFEGMFRHLVITGRSRLALYLARIPAGLAIIGSLVAIGFTIVCAVCVFAAPSKLSYDGVTVPAGLSQSGLESWASANATEVLCNFNYRVAGPQSGVGCKSGPGRPNQVVTAGPGGQPAPASTAQAKAAAIQVAQQDYPDYKKQFLYPSDSLMIQTGLWLELEAAIGFIVGLGLASLLGQRTVAVILMIVLEVILTPIAIRTRIPHFINLQRGIVGVATAHLEPGQLPLAFGVGRSGLPSHRIDHHRDLRHPRLAHRLDHSRCLANGNQRRMRQCRRVLLIRASMLRVHPSAGLVQATPPVLAVCRRAKWVSTNRSTERTLMPAGLSPHRNKCVTLPSSQPGSA